ncbi:MAG: Rieske (2Fe-2S) protein [Chloroflexi bacterium]|nr:Rieske (2Fe-2S) protein [Chloroflexota bacterium]
MHRRIERLIDGQAGWARPVGEWNQRWLMEFFGRTRPLKDMLNGVWLGHPVHPAVTDVPVGALMAGAVLDMAGLERAADIALATAVAGMAASAATGAADAVDAYGRPQVQATVHASIMGASLTACLLSLGLRATKSRALRPIAVALSLAGYAGVAAGAYVGGELTYGSGNMVDRHAWETRTAKWRALDVDDVPEGVLVRANAGSTALVLSRSGDEIVALDATCAHAGGPLDGGTVEDGCVECPWHGSRFALADGRVVRGPAVYDQPAWEIRRADGGRLEARQKPPIVA